MVSERSDPKFGKGKFFLKTVVPSLKRIFGISIYTILGLTRAMAWLEFFVGIPIGDSCEDVT
jgi:hypothetical protein